MAGFQFPLDNAEDYNGWITFNFLRIDLDTNIGSLFGDIGSLFQSASEAESEADVSDAPTPGEISVSREVTTDISTVRLYLPPSLNFNDGITYDNMVDLGAIGGAVNAALTTGNGGTITGDQIYNAISSSFRSVSDIIANGATADTARIAAMRASRFGGETTRNVVSNALRIAPNPNRRTLFRSVRPREFTFNFKLIANSPREAQEIDRIIKEFRTRMYPDIAQFEDEDTSIADNFIAFNYPDMVDIELTYNGRQVGNKIQRGYITNLSTTYNPSSMGFHIDGKPSEVDIVLSVFEERALDRRDIVQGY